MSTEIKLKKAGSGEYRTEDGQFTIHKQVWTGGGVKVGVGSYTVWYLWNEANGQREEFETLREARKRMIELAANNA